jgi:hypothetical protein
MNGNTQQSSTPTVAKTLIPGDLIAVNLVAVNPHAEGQRMAVNATFDHLGNPLDADGKPKLGIPSLDLALLSGNAAPEFPMVKYNELIESGQTEAAEDVKFAYEQEVENWKKGGNLPIQDAIGHAVLAWAQKAHNVSTTDHDGPVIKPEQVVVKSVVRNHDAEPGIFIVQLTPSWG